MMGNKIYRRPKVTEGQIKLQKGKIDGDIDICIYYGDNVPRHDRALLFNAFCSERLCLDLDSNKHVADKSLLEELEHRGYDLDTLRFSIQHKPLGAKDGE